MAIKQAQQVEATQTDWAAGTLERVDAPEGGGLVLRDPWLSFDGHDDYVDISGVSVTELADFTIELWACAQEGAPNASAISMGIPGNWSADLLIIYFGDTNHPEVPGCARIYADQATQIRTDSAVNDGQARHVALVKSGATVELLIDGVSTGTGTMSAAFTSTFCGIGAGSKNGTMDQHYRGWISEVRFWNYARTAAEIADDLDQRLAGTEPGLIHYYRLDEGAGATAQDAAGTVDGTINKAKWGDVGNAVRVTGKAHYAKPAAPIAADPMTIWCRYRFDGTADGTSDSWNTLFCRDGGAHHHLLIEAVTYRLGFYNNNFHPSDLALTPGNVYDIALVKNGTSFEIIVDGVLRLSSTAGFTSADGPLEVLLNYKAATDAAQGALGTFHGIAIFDVALTTAEVAALSDKGRLTGREPNLIHYYPGEVDGGALLDAVGGNNAALSGPAALTASGRARAGQRVSPPLGLDAAGRYMSSTLSWTEGRPAAATITVEVSHDGGSTWAACTNGGAIPGFTGDDDLRGKTILFRQSLETTDDSEPVEIVSLTATVTGTRAVARRWDGAAWQEVPVKVWDEAAQAWVVSDPRVYRDGRWL